jgi:DNA-binding MarR family transcriptional regulator
MATPLALNEFLPFRLNRLAAELSRRLHEIYGARYGIDIPEWRVIATLGAHEPVTAQEVVRSTRTHKSTISRAVAKLIDMGWIERVADDNDRRQMMLRFTTAGRKAYGELVPLVLDAERKVFAKLGRDAPAVREALTRLEQVLDVVAES